MSYRFSLPLLDSNRVMPWSVTSLGLDIVIDTVIATCVIYYLVQSKTVFAKYVPSE